MEFAPNAFSSMVVKSLTPLWPHLIFYFGGGKLGSKSAFFLLLKGDSGGREKKKKKDQLHAFISSYLLIFPTFIVAFNFQAYLSKQN